MIVVDQCWYCPECSTVGLADVGLGFASVIAVDGIVLTVGVLDGLVPPWNLHGLGALDVNHVEFSLVI